MGIFSFLSAKASASAIVIKDMVWMHRVGKVSGCLSFLKQNPDAALIAWFPETQQHWQAFMLQQHIANTVLLVRQINPLQLIDKKVIMLEHYPIFSKEVTFLQTLNHPEIIVLSSLDEPLFSKFGGERIITLMEKMGIKEDEPIEHTLVTQSLKEAQKKLEKKVLAEHSANSMQDWFTINVP